MSKNIRPLRRTGNTDIINAIRSDASLDYQRRVPEVTRATLRDTLDNLTQYRPRWNEFMDGLINRIGSVIVRNMAWENPLREFKTGMLTYGDTIEEIKTGLSTAHAYDARREYLEKDIFGTETPEVQTDFHQINRQEFYKITVNEIALRRAFVNEGELNSYLTEILESPVTSNNWDEFNAMCQLFAEWEALGAYHHVWVPDVSHYASTEDDAKIALRRLREVAGNLPFLSTKYNASGMPAFARPEDLVIFATPEFQSGIDVNALAAAFNIDKMQSEGRFFTIPAEKLNIDGGQAVVTTKDWFVVQDVVLENTTQPNPVGLTTNYFLHNHQIISASRHAPSVLLTTKAQTEVIHLTNKVDSISDLKVFDRENNEVNNASNKAVRGQWYNLSAVVNTENDDGTAEEIIFDVLDANSNGTFVSQDVLIIGGQETANAIQVRARAAYVDPKNPQAAMKQVTKTIGVEGELVPEWPRGGELKRIVINGVQVEDVTAGTTSYTLELGSTLDAATARVEVFTINAPDVQTEINAAGDTVTISVTPAKSGTPTVYTVTITTPDPDEVPEP